MKIYTIWEKINKPYLLAVFFWILVWQIGSMILGEEILLVSPFLALKRLFELMIEISFWQSVIFSFSKIILGFLLAFTIGILLGIISSNNKNFRILIEPLISTMQSIPVASIIILLLIWVSSKNLSIIVSFLMVLPVIYRNVLAGIISMPKDIKDMAQVFKVSKFNKFRYIYLSEAAPYLRSATSISLGLCWKSGVAAEVISIPSNSIGEKLYEAKIFLNTADLFAWTIVIVIISVFFQKMFLYGLDCTFRKLEIV